MIKNFNEFSKGLRLTESEIVVEASAEYEDLAKKVMDAIARFDTKPFITDAEATEVAAYHRDENNEPWDKQPYKEKTEKALEEFRNSLKKEFPNFNDEALDASDGTFLEHHFGNGFPYSSELNALSNRLQKAKISI